MSEPLELNPDGCLRFLQGSTVVVAGQEVRVDGEVKKFVSDNNHEVMLLAELYRAMYENWAKRKVLGHNGGPAIDDTKLDAESIVEDAVSAVVAEIPAVPTKPKFSLSEKSLSRLDGVHPDLVKVVKRSIELTEVDFTILEGMRTLKRQQELFDSGASSTMNSRHLTGHAVDLGAFVGGKVSWDWPLYHKITEAVVEAAAELGVKMEHGSMWKNFPDGPHHQLDWKAYPKGVDAT